MLIAVPLYRFDSLFQLRFGRSGTEAPAAQRLCALRQRFDPLLSFAELQLQQAHSKNNGQYSTFRKPLLTAAEQNEYTSNRFLTRIDSAAIREWMKQSWEVFVNSTIWLLLVVMAILMWAATSLLYKAGVHGDKEEYGMVFL